MKTLLKVPLALAVATGLHIVGGSPPSFAQTPQHFPTKPIRFVLASTPNVGGTDSLARIVGEKLKASWGQQVVVDNRPGAGGVLAGSAVAKAAPDGHTLFLVSGFAITAVMQPGLPYDPLKDFAGVTQIGHGTAVLVVTPALGVKSVEELITLTKAQPGKIIYGSGRVGSGDQLTGTRFIHASGIKVVNVAFKGSSEATIQLLGGHTHYAFVGFGNALPLIQDGKLLALAVTQRLPILPNVPTLAETLPEFRRGNMTSWGLLAPAATPHPIKNQISKEVTRILELPDVKARLPSLGLVAATTTPEEYDKILRRQIEIVSGVAKIMGLAGK